ncbi:MAG: hypothetical protein A2X82_10280 [Geobacteraceae bacterium GWC2_55_20]|nr:MAG: hypothetical protein A2X82_10280 [Geobacteraceae bacterium GWC2_55_20]HBA71651.1 hypothetical protein [Geobacter sp.]HCE67088.1 hypothetical protein [Geobacter sp.]
MPHSNELTRSKCYEIFSQSTGVEIRSAAKNHEERGVVVERSGRIQLRFFKLTPKTNPDDITQIRFVCEPDEAFELFHKISSVAASTTPCKEKLNPHKFSTGEPAIETVTTLTAEKWERNGKSGYALTVGRGKDFISVPLPLAKFLFAAEFLRYLSTDQCWVERTDKVSSKKTP